MNFLAFLGRERHAKGLLDPVETGLRRNQEMSEIKGCRSQGTRFRMRGSLQSAGFQFRDRLVHFQDAARFDD